MEHDQNQTLSNKLGKAIDIVVGPVQQRMANPIYGSFTLSWVILNWQPILFFIFSSKSIEDKLKYINDNFYTGTFLFLDYSWLMYLLFPLLISIIYVFGSPRLENWISRANRKPIISRINQLHDDKIEDFNKLKKIAIKEAEIYEVKTKFESLTDKDKTIEDLSNQILQAKNDIKDLENDLSSSVDRIKSFSTENTNSQINYTNLLSKYDKVTIEFPALLERVFRNIPFSEIENTKNEVMFLVSESTLLPNELKAKIEDAIDAGAAFTKSANPPFILNLEFHNYNKDAVKLVNKTVHNLFEVKEMVQSDDQLTSSYFARFKSQKDKFEMFDYILANLPLVKKVSLSNTDNSREK